MAIIAKLVVERMEMPIYNKHFFGNVKRSQKTEETTEFERMDNVVLPKFNKVQVVFNDGNYSYKVTIDKHLFEYDDLSKSFECSFTNTDGNLFCFTIFDGNDMYSLKEYYSKREYEDGDEDIDISDAVILYDDDVKDC